jgi:hypothetical protein
MSSIANSDGGAATVKGIVMRFRNEMEHLLNRESLYIEF